jgi:hypothetical protein
MKPMAASHIFIINILVSRLADSFQKDTLSSPNKRSVLAITIIIEIAV